MTLFETTPVTPSRQLPEIVTSGGRRLRPTQAFFSYWHVAAERQAMLFRRIRGDTVLTQDPILRSHRFTNAYRAADRVSQYLINHVIAGSEPDANDIVFRTLLFKFFNRAETWRSLETALGEPPHWRTFSVDRYDEILTRRLMSGDRVYSNAYVMPNPPFGHRYKHSNHLTLLNLAISQGLAHRLERAASLRAVYEELRALPSLGPFLAFQYAIDLNYSTLLGFSEMSFVVAGPGALEGIRKCFDDTGGYGPADVIRAMVDSADTSFQALGLRFLSLWGRPLHLIDAQNLFCETDKYCRVAHPELTGVSGRARIKQRYSPSREPLPHFAFPPRWALSANPLFGDAVSPIPG